MAINPLIALQGNNAFTKFSNVLSNIQGINQIQQQQEQAPARNQLLQAQADVTQSKVPTKQQTFNKDQREFSRSVADISRQIIPDLKAGNVGNAIQKLQTRSEQLKAAGLSSENTDRAILLAQSDPQELLDASEAVVIDDQVINPRPTGQLPRASAPIVNPDTGEFGFPVFDPRTQRASLVNIEGVSQLTPQQKSELSIAEAQQKVGIAVDRAGGVEEAKLAAQLEVKPKIKGREEEEKLRAQRNLLPKVKAAVANALADVKSVADSAGKVRSNETALNVYNTAMSSLSNALSDATTGPFIGLIPAVTANQQIADGAVAAMAPVLKQMFRSAGEGIFTDKDQELLIKMVPTRTDLKETRLAKIKNIDAIVKAKLAVPEVTPLQPLSQPNQQPVEQKNITVDF